MNLVTLKNDHFIQSLNKQVKNFGKRGRTKYTHLLDQDTTVKDKHSVVLRPDMKIMNKYLDRRSGVGKLY